MNMTISSVIYDTFVLVSGLVVIYGLYLLFFSRNYSISKDKYITISNFYLILFPIIEISLFSVLSKIPSNGGYYEIDRSVFEYLMPFQIFYFLVFIFPILLLLCFIGNILYYRRFKAMEYKFFSFLFGISFLIGLAIVLYLVQTPFTD